MTVYTYLHKPSPFTMYSPSIEYQDNGRISYETAMQLSDFSNGSIETCFDDMSECKSFHTQCQNKDSELFNVPLEDSSHGGAWFIVKFNSSQEFERIRDIICEVIDENNYEIEQY